MEKRGIKAKIHKIPVSEKTHMVKISKEAHEMLLQARNILLRQGYGGLPKQVVKEARPQSFNRGAIVGLGSAALSYLLSKEDKAV